MFNNFNDINGSNKKIMCQEPLFGLQRNQSFVNQYQFKDEKDDFDSYENELDYDVLSTRQFVQSNLNTPAQLSQFIQELKEPEVFDLDIQKQESFEEKISTQQQTSKSQNEQQPKTHKKSIIQNKKKNSRKNSVSTKISTEFSDMNEDFSEEDYQPEKIKKVMKKIRKLSSKKEDTKNLLRNFGGAQNKFVKEHSCSEQLQNEQWAHLNKKEKENKMTAFREWSHVKLENFKQFQEMWNRQGEFADLYREITFKFYENYAMNYVFTSRLTDQDTRMTHQKYIFRFLQGILEPSTFYYFKKTH